MSIPRFVTTILVIGFFMLLTGAPVSGQGSSIKSAADGDPETPDQSEAPVVDVSDSPSGEGLLKSEVFRPGEKIKLRVTYLGFTAGYLTVRVNGGEFNGEKVYRLKVTGESSGLAYWFYSVRDQFVSYVDATQLFSLGYDYRQNHGGEKEFEQVRYNQQEGLYFNNGEDTGTIPRYTMDMVSALFFIRSRDLEVGDSYRFPVHVSDEIYRLNIHVEGRETIATNQEGWVEAFRIKPTLLDPEKEEELKEKLKDNNNGVRIWISADQRKIPLQIGVPAKVGTFWGYLYEYEPGRQSTQ
jgi:hypothetical protein